MEDYRNEVITIETKFPGEVIGKKVCDSRGKCIGIVRSIKIDFSKRQTSLIFYTKEGSKEVPLKDIECVRNNVHLRKSLKREEIENEENKLEEKIKKEIKSLLTVSSLFMEES